ncbi:MAG: methylmalonyl-CoA epimerase [Dehalococcoidales bacterium]
MIAGVHHIGIAVSSIEEARRLYSAAFGLEVGETEIEEQAGIKIAWVPVGNTKLELVEPDDPKGELARQIEKRGEGMHHLALEVADIQDALETLKEKGFPLISEKPERGYGGAKVAWLHPTGTGKVLIELIERK